MKKIKKNNSLKFDFTNSTENLWLSKPKPKFDFVSRVIFCLKLKIFDQNSIRTKFFILKLVSTNFPDSSALIGLEKVSNYWSKEPFED